MEELIRKGYVSNPQQLYSVRRVQLLDGKAKGCSVIEVNTAGGLQVDILPDTGLDIGLVRYRGINISWISKNGYDSPASFIPYENEFVHTFPGGLLYTCGLRNAGPANRDNGEWHPLHGRYHGLQAEQVCTDVENGDIIVKGTIRESSLFGHVLELRRTIRIAAMGAQIAVEDQVTNLTPNDEEFMQIYHCNFGYPMLSEQAELILPKRRSTTPRTEFAKTGLGGECTFVEPIDNEEERVFFHENMEPTAILQNPVLGLQISMTWSLDTLPILAQWRSMASGDYVLGLEPTNCYIMGRAGERENGTLKTLKAFETRKTKVEFAFANI